MRNKLIDLLTMLLALSLLAACGADLPEAPAKDGDPPQQVDAAPSLEESTPPEQPDKLPEPPEQTPDERQAEFLSFLEEVNAQRRAIYDDPMAIHFEESWMPNLMELDDMFTAEQVETFSTTPRGTHSVTAQEASEDVETVFLLLKHSYGAYDYFGGDEVFLPLKEAVLASLPQEGVVSAKELEDALAEQLAPVLVDGHFTIGSTPMRDSHIKYMYYVDGLYFEDAGGLDPALVKRTIDENGRLRLCLAALATPEEAEALPEALTIQGIDVALSWQQDSWSRSNSPDIFTESTLPGGTPLLTSTAMYAADRAQQKQLDRLAECGDEYAGAPVLVLDVRSNGGGSNLYINKWFAGYTGQSPSNRLSYVQKRSPLNRYLYATGKMGSSDRPDISEWSGYSYSGQFVEHDGITLVLQDKGVASSGETVVMNMRTLENTIFIGSNTLGCTLTPNNFDFYLPHSGLDLYFGTCLLLMDDGSNQDGTGFQPDLWVPSAQAEARAEAIIEYYGLSAILA